MLSYSNIYKVIILTYSVICSFLVS